MLGPDAGIDDADDHTIAGVVLPAKLAPEPVVGRQAKERRAPVGLDVVHLGLADRKDTGRGPQDRRLAGLQPDCEAREAVAVVVHRLVRLPGLGVERGKDLALLPVEEADVIVHRLAVGLDVSRASRARRRKPGLPAPVARDRQLTEPDDIQSRVILRIDLVELGARDCVQLWGSRRDRGGECKKRQGGNEYRDPSESQRTVLLWGRRQSDAVRAVCMGGGARPGSVRPGPPALRADDAFSDRSGASFGVGGAAPACVARRYYRPAEPVNRGIDGRGYRRCSRAPSNRPRSNPGTGRGPPGGRPSSR